MCVTACGNASRACASMSRKCVSTVSFGTPAGAYATYRACAVEAEIVEHSRGDKIKVFKKKRRKNYHRTRGHRQDLTTVKITAIKA